MFHLIRLDTKEPLENEAGNPITFETGPEASTRAKALSESLGVKVQPRRLVVDSSWHEREQARFASGEYMKLAWLDEKLWYTNVMEAASRAFVSRRATIHEALDAVEVQHGWQSPAYNKASDECSLKLKALDIECCTLQTKNHFAHISIDDPLMVAFTKNDEMGLADRQTRMSSEAYLKRYWPDAFTASEIDTLVQVHNETYVDHAFKLATVPDEIEQVYTNFDRSCDDVATSCMRGTDWKYGEHPCRVYGAGDLAIAYLTNKDGETTHRALCWPERKLYSRMYGKGDRLHARLKMAGYSKSAYYDGGGASLEGARLLRIELDCNSEEFVMPYVDENIPAKDDGKFLILSRAGRICTRQTNGTTAEEPEEGDGDLCSICEERVDETTNVYTRANQTSSVQMCECCRGSLAFWCDGYEKYFHSGRVNSYEVNGETWSARYFELHGARCEHTGDNYSIDAMVEVIVSTEGHTERWYKGVAATDAFEHEGKLYDNDIKDEILGEDAEVAKDSICA